jgi:hypothetical protein
MRSGYSDPSLVSSTHVASASTPVVLPVFPSTPGTPGVSPGSELLLVVVVVAALVAPSTPAIARRLGGGGFGIEIGIIIGAVTVGGGVRAGAIVARLLGSGACRGGTG